MRKKIFVIAPFILALLVSTVNALAQEDKPGGKPIARIFADYKHQVNGDGSFRGFGLSRAYLGYLYKTDNHLTAQILLDIGSPLRTEEVTSRRYTYIRNAFISYRMEKLTLTAGITDVRGHVASRDFWGKRYISTPFLLYFKYIEVADIGIIADYSVSSSVTLNMLIMNGEGYNNIQNDSTFLYGAGVTFKPAGGFVFRFYTDTYGGAEARKNTFATFAGYRHDKFSVGGEFNYKTDFDWTDNHNVYGYSFVASYNINDHFELFGRYDRSLSVTVDGEQEPWNATNDGSLIISGIQYTYSRHLRLAFNYQGWNPSSDLRPRWDFLQVNAEFRF